MSFCTDLKNELIAIRLPACCKPSLAYGLMLFGRSFCYKRISMQTQNKDTADFYAETVRRVYGAAAVISSGGEKRLTYRVCIPSETDRLRILASIDFGIYESPVNRSVFERDCCRAAFIRGAFITCGTVCDPAEGYRADFSVRDTALADELVQLLSEQGITAKIASRSGAYTVYIKESGMLEDLFTLIGASNRSLDIMDTKIIKGLKNNMNRARNCDSANISKTVEASIAQRTAIEFLEANGRLEGLPEELRAAAVLRRDNPDSSLKELCRISDEAITVSGLNHRLRRITDIYTELKKL